MMYKAGQIQKGICPALYFLHGEVRQAMKRL